jgi:hypothetical protein
MQATVYSRAWFGLGDHKIAMLSAAVTRLTNLSA